MDMIAFVKRRLNEGGLRTQKIRKNIGASFLLKGVGVATSLLLIPTTIHYVNPTRYGIWLTLSSIVAWIAYFDLGLTLGFKNCFAQAMAMDNRELAKQQVSTTMALMALLFAPLCVVLLAINQFLDWPSLINVDSSYGTELRRVFNVLIVCFCSDMVMRVIGTMLDADQRPALRSLIFTIGQVLSLAVIYCMTFILQGSLVSLSFAFSALPLLVTLVASFVIFSNKRYRSLTPRLSAINFKLTKQIMNLGVQFFIIMISLLVIFQCINVIISRTMSPLAVTQYNVAFKYFNVLYMLFSIILAPFWAAFTDAYTSHDQAWMKKALATLERLWLLSLPVMIVMLLLSPWFYDMWVGGQVQVPFSLSASVACYVLSIMLGGLYMYPINGTGKVRIQLYIYVGFAMCSIPIMTMACKHYGIEVMLLVPTVVYLTQAFFGRIQLKRLINGKAKGLWNK